MDLVPLKKQTLTRAQFEQLADVPPEEEWLANITNLKTRRAYKEDVREFIAFTALQDYMGLRSVGRSHIISWRKDMERRGLAPASIRRKLSALSSLFDYLCERNAVTGNPVDGVKWPTGTKAARRHSATRRPGNYWKRRPRPRSRASGIGPSWLLCCITLSQFETCALALHVRRLFGPHHPG